MSPQLFAAALAMPETRITAQLPIIDIELMHRELTEQNAELITAQIRATPSFEAMERWLVQSAAFAPGQPFALQLWTDILCRAWLPWLAMNPALVLFVPRATEGG
ncbi:hypothetical protein CupriaWKF_34210 [Cupriavidus sp. WKF15]|uniref:hypothetical protein n=1 Tax=Cupriavidus sp. WKF15 TaxID=3032282 RepID=UPI0023E2C694|nr:hypothetical protein [Cupriavidus sp. WKF15]WER50566.1 hypothetical protein CupriaWKF_34210 [Cupriavidus sp. WKF15]